MANESVSKNRLIPISYYDPSKETRLSACADAVVYERDGYSRILRAIRFGGYPEMVHALTDAIFAGATIDAQMEGENFRLKAEVKRYKRQTGLTREKSGQKNLPFCGGLCDNNDDANYYFFAQGRKRGRFFT